MLGFVRVLELRVWVSGLQSFQEIVLCGGEGLSALNPKQRVMGLGFRFRVEGLG